MGKKSYTNYPKYVTTENRKMYHDEITRLNKIITDLRYEGFIVDYEEYIPTFNKRVTNTLINKLKSISKEDILNDITEYIVPNTGQTIRYNEMKKIIEHGLPETPAGEVFYKSIIPSEIKALDDYFEDDSEPYKSLFEKMIDSEVNTWKERAEEKGIEFDKETARSEIKKMLYHDFSEIQSLIDYVKVKYKVKLEKSKDQMETLKAMVISATGSPLSLEENAFIDAYITGQIDMNIYNEDETDEIDI